MRTFLRAEWRDLALLNWRVPRELLEPHVPPGTELDHWNGAYYVSLVGFLFLNTQVLGVPVPFHKSFEEVNLRFYVRRSAGMEVRRGVVFLQELVSRPAVAAAARLSYNEPYRVAEMDYHVARIAPDERPSVAEYRWRWSTEWCGLSIAPNGSPSTPEPGSEEEFIAEKPWGYTRQRDGGTIEYRVDHPSWQIWQVADARVYGSVGGSPGELWSIVFGSSPHSAFFADGSPVTVSTPARVDRRR